MNGRDSRGRRQDHSGGQYAEIKGLVLDRDTTRILQQIDIPRNAPTHLNPEYEVFVRNVGSASKQPPPGYMHPTSSSNYKRHEWDASPYREGRTKKQNGNRSRSRTPVKMPPRDLYELEVRPTTPKKRGNTDEIHELILKINDAILDLEDRDLRRQKGEPERSSKLNTLQRKSLSGLVDIGHRVLDGRSGQELDLQGLKDNELKHVLINMKLKLLDQLTPSERNYYDKMEKARIKRKMNDIEDKMHEIVDRLSKNREPPLQTTTKKQMFTNGTKQRLVLEPEEFYRDEPEEEEEDDEEEDEEQRREREQQKARELAKFIRKLKSTNAIVPELEERNDLQEVIQEKKEMVEKLKESHPIESEEDERIQEPIEKYEKKLDQIERKAQNPNTDQESLKAQLNHETSKLLKELESIRKGEVEESELPPKELPVEKEKENPPGTFVKKVALNSCEGAITVIKIIKETILAVGYSSGEIGFYSLTDNFKLLSKSQEHKGSITALESGDFGFNGQSGMKNRQVLLSGGNEKDKGIVVWDIASFQPIKKMAGHKHMITSIIDLQDSATIVTGSMDSTISFWDLRNGGDCIQILEDLRFPVIVMEYDSDESVLATGTLDGQLSVWQVYFENGIYLGCAVQYSLSLESHVLDVLRTSTLPGKLVTLESDFYVRLYELGSGRLLSTIKAPKPIIDVFIVEAQNSMPIIFAIDNSNGIYRLPDLRQPSPSSSLKEAKDTNEVHIKRYIGYNPKSQIFINGDSLYLLTADQIAQNLIINKLNMT